MPTFNFAEHCDVAERSRHEKVRHETVRHGTHCDCVLLAAALGLGAEVISFDCCRNFLQHRWAMTCKHGEVQDTRTLTPLRLKWKDKGEMNPVLAILVKNA